MTNQLVSANCPAPPEPDAEDNDPRAAEPTLEPFDAEEEQTPAPVFCTADVYECPDGSFVGRVAPDCEFEACPETEEPVEETEAPEDPPAEPELVACTLELAICPDGSSVGRTGPDCEFEPCPETDAPATEDPEVVPDVMTDAPTEVIELELGMTDAPEDPEVGTDAPTEVSVETEVPGENDSRVIETQQEDTDGPAPEEETWLPGTEYPTTEAPGTEAPTM
ncbi:expressed unknown protein [Seminavis robusta]|uniref:Uncharacterized protein n=1 Tax=Seminavis robusta TaxID=568900 RepID=A0A9N8F4D0_9STRA|nr:expressed unknown protein [Seminavis robusta]|eukprot:Sro3394_g347540.1 n/a (222) ;mRNA; f:6185-6850